jgi:hypothetical protein
MKAATLMFPLLTLLACNPDTDEDGLTHDAGSDPNNGFEWPAGEGHWPDFSDEAEADGVTGTGA